MAGTLKWPATCKVITQQYGVKNARYVSGYHTGIDIGCQTGSAIYAAHDGKVTLAGWAGAYGNTVEIDGGGGFSTSYHHMSKVAATVGQNVSAGSVIGYIGSTGNSTGPHLHFEVRMNGKAVDPNPYLSGSTVIPAGTTNATPAGLTDIPGSIVNAAKWMTDTVNWLRIGMVIAGALLLYMSFVGIARAQALGALSVKKVAATVKGKGNGES